MPDKICPLRNTNCSKDCAWYVEVISGEGIYDCVLVDIAYRLDSIKNSLMD